MPARLDVELVRRGLARSREHAVDLLAAGSVTVDGRAAVKPATRVEPDAAIAADQSSSSSYVSRGATKLAGALDTFGARGLSVAGMRCLDAGASTGGFTQVLLERGASQVVAVDVGSGQLAPVLRADTRVVVHERVNVRGLQPSTIGGLVDLAVADLSFISLTLVLAALDACVTHDGDVVVMVKPQFEVGRERLGAGGVVRDQALRLEALEAVARTAGDLGRGLAGVVPSVLPGQAGNVEYFMWFRHDVAAAEPAALRSAVEQGPA